MVIKVHSQAVLRIVDPAQGAVTEDEFIEAEETEAEYVAGVADGDITSISDDQRAARQHAAPRPDRQGPPAGLTPAPPFPPPHRKPTPWRPRPLSVMPGAY